MEKTPILTILQIQQIRYNSRTKLQQFIYHHMPVTGTEEFLDRLSDAIEQEKKRAVDNYRKSKKK